MSYEKNEVQKMQGLRLIATKNGIKFNEGSEVVTILAGWDVDPYQYMSAHSDSLEEIFDVPIINVRYKTAVYCPNIGGFRNAFVEAKLAMFSDKMGEVISAEMDNSNLSKMRYYDSGYAESKEMGKKKRISACRVL